MRTTRLPQYTLLLLSLSVITFAKAAPPDAAAVVSQASQAFSSGRPIASVEMTGTAHWGTGSTQSSGSVTLVAKATGENRVEFNLSNGVRVEAQSAIGDDRTCTWSGRDGISHNMAMSNCWTSTIWFLPHLVLQESGLPPGLAVQYAGMVNGKGHSAPHIQHQFAMSSGRVQAKLAKQIQVWSQTDLVLDPSTYLPSSLTYSIHPDNNSSVNLKVEVRYSNYKKVKGLELPMHIERYVNGNLQVGIDIDVDSVTVN